MSVKMLVSFQTCLAICHVDSRGSDVVDLDFACGFRHSLLWSLLPSALSAAVVLQLAVHGLLDDFWMLAASDLMLF